MVGPVDDDGTAAAEPMHVLGYSFDHALVVDGGYSVMLRQR